MSQVNESDQDILLYMQAPTCSTRYSIDQTLVNSFVFRNTESTDSLQFILDGGCTHHMVDLPLIDIMKLDNKSAEAVAVALRALKIGNIVITDVLRIPGFRYNLLLEGQLDNRGCVITKTAGEKRVEKKGAV